MYRASPDASHVLEVQTGTEKLSAVCSCPEKGEIPAKTWTNLNFRISRGFLEDFAKQSWSEQNHHD